MSDASAGGATRSALASGGVATNRPKASAGKARRIAPLTRDSMPRLATGAPKTYNQAGIASAAAIPCFNRVRSAGRGDVAVLSQP